MAERNLYDSPLGIRQFSLKVQDEFYRDLLRSARATALADAEGFVAVVHVLELMGQQLSGSMKGLADYKPALVAFAGRSPFFKTIPTNLPPWHTSFSLLFDELRHARNDAVHQGSYARTLTSHALEVAMVLEDALTADASIISQFMVREVVVAKTWYPISYVRQLMLTHAFSYLPVFDQDAWSLIPESSIARYLRSAESIAQKKERLLINVGDALARGLPTIAATTIGPTVPICEAVNSICDHPLLVLDEKDSNRLVGLLTASDIL